jgi:hypothetical protein
MNTKKVLFLNGSLLWPVTPTASSPAFVVAFLHRGSAIEIWNALHCFYYGQPAITKALTAPNAPCLHPVFES